MVDIYQEGSVLISTGIQQAITAVKGIAADVLISTGIQELRSVA